MDEPEKFGTPNKLIGNESFGLTLAAVEARCDELKGELKQIDEKLAEDGLQSGLKDFLDKIKVKITDFLRTPPAEILRLSQEVYDFVKKLEGEGLERDDILRTMQKEKPALVEAVFRYSHVIENRTVWGYRIFQHLHALSFRE